MTELQRGLRARLARLLVGLGVRRGRRGKEISEEARPRDRPWGGQSCPDLAQEQGSTSDVSLKVQAQSRSECDLRVGSQCGFWSHKQGRGAQPLGRLQRPAVGSAGDLASYGSMVPESATPSMSSAASAGTRHSSKPESIPPCVEQGPQGCTFQKPPNSVPEVPLRPKLPSNLEASSPSPLPRPVSFPRAEGAKGKADTSEPAQTPHPGPSVKRTHYHITVTLQGCGQTPREEPARPAPHLCGPEESRGWQEPPQGPRPITGCPANPPREPQLSALSHQGRAAQWQQELRAGGELGFPHSRELDHSVTRTSQDRLLGPDMEETAGPQTRSEARVVSATLTWRQRPPAPEETRHRFHKVSLVSGSSHMDGPQEEMFEHSFRREEVNGFVTKDEETVNYQGPGDEAESTPFQSHGPIFSKKYTLPAKEKRPVGRLKEAVDRSDGGLQAPRTEPPSMGAMARTELLVPLPGPREPSPHPNMGVTSGNSRNHEEWRVTRTVRTTTLVGGHVDRRVSSSVTVRPTMSGETLPRGRNVTRTVRAVVVNPGAEGSPSRSQALELLSSLVPAERSPPASRLPRPTGPMARSSGLGGTGGKTLAQSLETGTAELNDSSDLTPSSIPAVAYPLRNQGIPAAHPAQGQDQDRALDTSAGDSLRVQGTPSPNLLPLQTSQGQPPAPSSPRPQTHVPSLDLVHSPEQPVVSILTRTHPTAHAVPLIKVEEFSDSSPPPILPMVRDEVTVADPPAPSSLPSPDPSVTSSPKNKLIRNSENVSTSALTQKETLQGPTSPSLTSKEVVRGPGAAAVSSPRPTEVVQGREEASTMRMEVVQSPQGSSSSCFQKEAARDTGPTFLTSKQDEGVQGSKDSPILPPAPKQSVQSCAEPLVPSIPEIKVSPSLEGTPAPVPMRTEANMESQLVPDLTEGKMSSEPSREEDEAALTADLEIFLDTLRSMEPPEILHTHRLPRAPRSSYLTMYATLPAIEEDQPGPWVPGPSPQEGPSLEEEEEELENPYLSDDEKLQRRQEKAEPSPSWELRPAKPTQVSCSPLEMMKKHLTGAKGSHSEPGPESLQPSNRPTSRLGGSLLFGNLVPTTKDVPALEPLGTKLSALPPHRAPGLRKVPGQLPLLCSGRPQPEKPARTKPPEGWSPTLKTQGKLNTRPGKVILFSEPGFQGSSREVWGDIPDASGWAPIASIRVVRGCWVLYEQPEFQGQKLVLPEGDMEVRALASAWTTQGIGSLRRVVRDYCTPEISLFSEEGLTGEQMKLTEALKDSQGLERPLKVASATVSAGLWLLYPKSSFEDTPYILERGEYPTSEAWGASDSSVGSLKPMRLGCPSVEKPGEPKAVVYEAPDFQGRSWEVSRDIYNLQQPEDNHSPQLASVGSLRILGGCWVGYEKEGFRGHQYLLEEGEYADWSQWGGYDELLTSLRVIRTDFGDPAVVLFEAMDFEGHGVEVSSALPDVELLQHGPSTQAIHVLSGVWVAYEQVGFSGEQYVLEKGVYRNCDDWGAGNSALGSLQPVLQVGEHDLHFVSKIQLFSGPDFLGDHISFEDDQASLPASFLPRSCRVQGGSWILFDEKNFEGEQHILSEGEFPTLTAMGCLASTVLGSLRKVPLHFSEPAIFLYGLECFEGKEIELGREVRSLQAQGFNNHVLSVRIKGGVWVLCEHSDFRGRQWLVGSCEITNWLTYSGTQRVGSLYPIKQRRVYFRLWNAALGGFLAVPDHVEDMKAGRVVVSEPRAGGSCVWYYEDGLLKNQVAPTMSLQVIGPPSLGSKVVLWAESRLPHQTWSISELGHICSQMFEGWILDVKGGRGYDRDHVVLWELAKDRPSQIWTLHVL